MLTLRGQVALVTGGSRGIGRAIAVLFGRLGAKVAVNYVRDADAAARTVEQIRQAGGEAEAFAADVADHAQAGRLVADSVRSFGTLDVLVANHGIWKRGPIDTMTPAQWDETLRTNLGGAFNVCQHASRVMIAAKRGAIILIASTSGQRGEAHYSHYSASKGAILSFTKSLAAELAPHGIRVNGVAPGWVMTDMSRSELEGPDAAKALAAIPLGRAATAEEIAGPVAFLASELSTYLYGEILCVNGGAVMAD